MQEVGNICSIVEERMRMMKEMLVGLKVFSAGYLIP
jgi:hypothetical protein